MLHYYPSRICPPVWDTGRTTVHKNNVCAVVSLNSNKMLMTQIERRKFREISGHSCSCIWLTPVSLKKPNISKVKCQRRAESSGGEESRRTFYFLLCHFRHVEHHSSEKYLIWNKTLVCAQTTSVFLYIYICHSFNNSNVLILFKKKKKPKQRNLPPTVCGVCSSNWTDLKRRRLWFKVLKDKGFKCV